MAPAAGGGFDVAGTHTYAASGTYHLSASITDIGGSNATASSTASIGTPQPAPPPFPTFALPTARFGFAPFSPCQNDTVSFDASTSTGGGDGLPITMYRWSVAESAFAPIEFTSAKPTFTHVFPPASYSVGPYEGPLPNKDLNDYHFFRPPATVTLEVTDSAGHTASLSRTITFVDPDELLVGEIYTNRQTGLPGLSLFRDSRFSAVIPCQAHSLDPKSTIVKLARPSLPAAARLRQSGAGARYRASIALRTPCRAGLVQCSGELIVSQAAPRRLRASRSGSAIRGALGHATFFIPAGRNALVTVRLNAHGRALARADKLRRVTLSLLTSGPRSGVARISRTIVVVRGRGKA